MGGGYVPPHRGGTTGGGDKAYMGGGFAREFRDFFEGRILLKYDLLRTPEY